MDAETMEVMTTPIQPFHLLLHRGERASGHLYHGSPAAAPARADPEVGRGQLDLVGPGTPPVASLAPSETAHVRDSTPKGSFGQ
jgi:hypothetical protein